MPVTQWDYYDLLRLDCNPVAPPAEEWRQQLHDRSSGKVWTAIPAMLRSWKQPLGLIMALCFAAFCFRNALHTPSSIGSSRPGGRSGEFDARLSFKSKLAMLMLCGCLQGIELPQLTSTTG